MADPAAVAQAVGPSCEAQATRCVRTGPASGWTARCHFQKKPVGPCGRCGEALQYAAAQWLGLWLRVGWGRRTAGSSPGSVGCAGAGAGGDCAVFPSRASGFQTSALGGPAEAPPPPTAATATAPPPPCGAGTPPGPPGTPSPRPLPRPRARPRSCFRAGPAPRPPRSASQLLCAGVPCGGLRGGPGSRRSPWLPIGESLPPLPRP